MRRDAKSCQDEGETIHEPEECLDANDGIDEVAEEARGEDGVLLDKLGEVIEAGCYGESEEAEAKDKAEVA